MKGWLLYKNHLEELSPEAYEVPRFLEEAKKQGIGLEVVTPYDFEIIATQNNRKSVLLRNEETTLPDFVLTRMGSGTTYYALAIIRHLEKLGVLCINSSTGIEQAKDKLHSHQILAERGIPIPKTMLAKFPTDVSLVGKHIGYPLVAKTLSGSQGQGVFLVKDAESLGNMMEITEANNPTANILLQEYMETSHGRDIRVIVIGGVPICGMLRTAKENKFKANFSQGADVEPIQLTNEMRWLASESSRALGLEISGVDLLYSPEGLKICEVNSSPGFEGMEKAHKNNVPETMFDFLRVRSGNGNNAFQKN